MNLFFFFSSRRRHTRCSRDWSSDVCSSDLLGRAQAMVASAQGNWVQVGLPPNFSWGYLGQQLGSGNIASQHAFLIDGELITGGKLRWNRAIAEQEILRA